MPQSKVPRRVRERDTRHESSVGHFAVFNLLQRNRNRFWSAAQIAAELKIADAVAAGVLERLASDNFLDVKIGSDLLYRFNPATPMPDASAERAAERDRRKPVADMKRR